MPSVMPPLTSCCITSKKVAGVLLVPARRGGPLEIAPRVTGPVRSLTFTEFERSMPVPLNLLTSDRSGGVVHPMQGLMPRRLRRFQNGTDGCRRESLNRSKMA
jgi:hypothetical protein